MPGELTPLVAVYLNQRVVFDILAMLQGGIATVTKVSDSQRGSSSSASEIGGGVGFTAAIASLLKIDLSAKRSRASDEGSVQARDEERVHTPASLFFTLRRLLLEKGLLRVISDVGEPVPGEMVEFSAALSRNPVIETMDAFAEKVIALAITFSAEPDKGKGGRPSQLDQQRQLKKQIESFTEVLRAGDTIDLVTSTPLPSGYRAVVTVERQYLNDPAMADLVDGTFKVLGKVIRAASSGQGSVSLIRKTALSRLPAGRLQEAFAHLERLETEQGFVLPRLTFEIEGPVIHVLPVAIFA